MSAWVSLYLNLVDEISWTLLGSLYFTLAMVFMGTFIFRQ